MGGNAEENTAFRPMCFGTGAEGFCVIKYTIAKLMKIKIEL